MEKINIALSIENFGDTYLKMDQYFDTKKYIILTIFFFFQIESLLNFQMNLSMMIKY